MLGTVTEKFIRLADHLARHPHDVVRYATKCKAKPLAIELPWFSWAAIDFLQDALKPEQVAFEYGSDGSTLFLSQRVKQVVSVEDDLEYFELIEKVLRERGARNVDYRFASSVANPYEQSAFVRALDRRYDVIIIDGSELWPENIVRPACFERAENFIAPGGMIVVDDSWRYDSLIRSNSAKSHRRFQGVGPGRFGVTSTDIYCY